MATMRIMDYRTGATMGIAAVDRPLYEREAQQPQGLIKAGRLLGAAQLEALRLRADDTVWAEPTDEPAPTITRAMVRELSEALDPQRQGEQWPDPVRWDGRPLEEQARDLLVLVPPNPDERTAQAVAAIKQALGKRTGRPRTGRREMLMVRLHTGELEELERGLGRGKVSTWMRQAALAEVRRRAAGMEGE